MSNFPDNVLAFVCKGRVTKADYDSVLLPAVAKALEKHDRVRLCYETGADFAGIAPGAVREDFKVGMDHFTRWERVALVTDVEWIKRTRLFSFLMPAAMMAFPTSQAAQARAWIVPPIEAGEIASREGGPAVADLPSRATIGALARAWRDD